MAHELNIDATGKASIALKGGAKSAWHGLGQEILATDSIATIQQKAGLDWEALASPVTYCDAKGHEYTFDGRQVVYRSDTGAGLGLTSDNRYNIVQPAEIMSFFKDFLAENKMSIETAGAIRGGRIIWCLAKLDKDYQITLPGKDVIDGYVRLQTSFDTTRATDLVATRIRQVCANTARMVDADAARDGYRTNHSIKFDAKHLQESFGLLGEQHKITAKLYNELVKRKVTQDEAAKFFCELMGVETDDIGKVGKDGKKLVSGRTENQLKELAAAFKNAPGASSKAANGTAFGLLEAVTYYVDHGAKVRKSDGDSELASRINSAWFGSGEQLKEAAHYYAADLADCLPLIGYEKQAA